MKKKNHRLKWTDDSREYNIILRSQIMHDNHDERKGVCACRNCRGYWDMHRYHRQTRRYQRNWKQYRRNQYKIK